MDMPIIIEPRFQVMTVNIARILKVLNQIGITYKIVAKAIGSNSRTVYGWAHMMRRPRSAFMIYILIDFACRFIKPIYMNKCGVTG